MARKVSKSDEQWQRELTPAEFAVLRRKGTEQAFGGLYWNNKRKGAYHCKGCGASLFSSDAKFDSGSGWPSFREPAAEDCTATEMDDSHGMVRAEVLCATCGGHLGHVFDDGPAPTGKRYCINSVALTFKKNEDT